MLGIIRAMLCWSPRCDHQASAPCLVTNSGDTDTVQVCDCSDVPGGRYIDCRLSRWGRMLCV